jgi:2-oxoisovalerate dehydrogenase E2 component (dihydrolipoyl transacylase)
MPSVREFPLPDLGEGLTSAEIVRWLVEVGDVIAVDQPVAEVETAKAVVEVPCPYGGVVTARFGEAGAEVPVGAALVTVAVSGPASEPIGSGPSGSAGSSGSGNVLVGYGTTESTGSTRRRRAGTATAPRPAPVAAPVQAAAALPAAAAPAAAVVPAVISPLVRRLAREHQVDLATLRGSGPDGLILRADVEQRITGADRDGGRPQLQVVDQDQAGELIPLRGAARLAAERFTRSRHEIPDATCWVDADATGLLAARDALNQGRPDSRIGLLPLLARICTAALARHPELNSTVVTDADGAPTGVRRNQAVHLGFAAQTERGLVVPVVRDAHLLSTEQLAAEMARLTSTARAGRLAPAELTGGTFTLNNYGVFGVDGSTPIINHPEAAMLGVGRITAKPWVVGGELAVRQVVQLSLTFDHRVCDGATAGGLLRLIADAVESPAALLRYL